MNSLRKFRVTDTLNWVPFLCAESNFRIPKYNLYVDGSSRLQFIRLCATESAISLNNDVDLGELTKRSRLAKHEAEAVLLDYFHFTRIGKIYKEATEVFRLEHGALDLKLRPFQDLGLNEYLVSKIIASSHHLLKGDMEEEFIEVLERLKNLGIEYGWLGDNISLDDSYNWKCMLQLMCFLNDLGFSPCLQRELLIQHPDILLEQSGRITCCLFGFFLKFGSTLDVVRNTFRRLPKMPVLEFAYNLHISYKFLVEIGMAVEDIGELVRLHPRILGSCKPKNVTSLTNSLNCGKNKLCEMLMDDPLLFKKWALGVKVTKLQPVMRVELVRVAKTKFLTSLGFEENSMEMQKALTVFRGKAVDLQERFDFLVSMGLNREALIEKVKLAPQILNQPTDIVEKKVRVFVKDLGYSVTDLLQHIKLLSYTMERLKRRHLMYKWLREERLMHPKLALSTIMAASEKEFVKTYVNRYPEAPQFYERLKKEIYSCGE